MSVEKKAFARETTGLVREIGPLTAIIISVATAIGWGWQTHIFAAAAASPLPDNLWFAGIPPYVMAAFIGGIAVLLVMVGYSILAAAMPRSGGGYVAISRIISPSAGFVASWLVFLSLCWSFGLIAGVVIEGALYFVGAGLLPIQMGSYSDVVVFIGGTSLIVIFTIVAAFGVKLTGYTLQVLFWIPAILTVYVLFLLVVPMMSPAVLERGISAWAQSQGVAGVSADTYVKAALAQGLDAANVGSYWTAVSVSLYASFWAYSGFAANSFVVGEVKEPKKNLPKIMIIAIVTIMVLYLTVAYFAASAAASVGRTRLPNGNTWSFFDAYSFLSSAGSLGHAGVPPFRIFVPILASMSALGLGLGSLNILIFLFGVVWIVNDIPPLVLSASRIIFAMSFDGVLPASFAKVNTRFHSPVYAVVLAGIFGVQGTLAWSGVLSTGGSWNPGGSFGDVLNGIFSPSYGVLATDLLDAVFFSLFALAVLLFPFRKSSLFESAYFKPGGRIGVATIGLAGLIANLMIGWTVLTSGTGSYNILAPNPDNLFALGFDLLLGIVGLGIYAYYRWGPPRKHVDYSAIFSEVPPE